MNMPINRSSLGRGSGRNCLSPEEQKIKNRRRSSPLLLSPCGRGISPKSPTEQGVQRTSPLTMGVSRPLRLGTPPALPLFEEGPSRSRQHMSPPLRSEPPTGECCFCNRPAMLIICRSCGHTFSGRVRSPCVDHPTTIHLMDFDCCPACKAYQIQEFKQVNSPATPKKQKLDENQNIDMECQELWM